MVGDNDRSETGRLAPKARALIQSLGGTPEPLVEVLRAKRPEIVCFLVSEQSAELIEQVRTLAEGAFDIVSQSCDNPEDVVACYRAALACIEVVRGRGYRDEDVVIDFTGGTKPMSAGLVLAAARTGMRFCYVGGDTRSKGGLGVVVSGMRRIERDRSPWQLFAVEEKIRIAQHFNTCQYGAARSRLQELVQRPLDENERPLLTQLSQVVLAYDLWDRFNHRKARKNLRPALSALQERCRRAKAAEYDDFLRVAEKSAAWLDRLTSVVEERNGKFLPHRLLALDLLANAERRMDEAKYDDAVARLYRTIEMVGQAALFEATGHLTDAVPVDVVPERLRGDYEKRYGAGNGKMKLPLEATFRLLETLGHPAGRVFSEQYEEMRKILNARNQSILAHGTDPVKEATAKALLTKTLAMLGDDVERPQFPKLPW